MICKKCGAYNPDHATYCKVCAANLKEQPDIDDAAEVTEAEEVAEEELRPRRGSVKAPDLTPARRAGSFKAARKADEPDDEEEEDDVEEVEEEEEEKPAKKASIFSRPAAPAKKRRIVDEEEDEDEDDEDEDDEDEYDEDDGDAEKLESEPKTTRFSRTASKKRRVVKEEEDEDEDDEDDEDEEYDEDEDDGYEEYEPTPPRRKKSGRSQGSSGGPNLVTLLIVCLLAILLIIVGIIAFCNIKGGETKNKLPSFLQFNCAGKTAAVEKTSTPPQQQPTAPVNEQDTNPTDAPVTGTQVDYSVTKMEELIDSEGKPCISISMTSRPGDIVTIVLPNQDDYVVQNDQASDVPYLLTIPKSCFFPNTPLTESVYTVTPQILVTHADGTQESLHVDSFDITFPTVQLELLEPAEATIPAEGLMAGEGNELLIKGQVDDHSVSVTVNGQPVTNMYTGGIFEYTYTVTGDEPETVTVEASKVNCVPASYSFIVTPYIFVPEKMPLTVVSEIDKLRADKNSKVVVTGTTAPGATLTATPAAEFQSAVACGSPTVDAEGNYSFEVTFSKDYYGIASITIHAKKDGYEEGETTCNVSRMYADRQAAIKGYNRTKSYHEVPSSYAFAKVMENPSDGGFYRFVGKVVEVDPETGVITFAAKTSNKETVNIYVLNASAKWDPAKKIGGAYKLYATLNGLYTDGTSLYITAWFVMND